MVMIVVMKLTAPRIVPRPDSHRPRIHRSPPTPGERAAADNGEYPVHPQSAAPPGVAKPPIVISAPNR